MLAERPSATRAGFGGALDAFHGAVDGGTVDVEVSSGLGLRFAFDKDHLSGPCSRGVFLDTGCVDGAGELDGGHGLAIPFPSVAGVTAEVVPDETYDVGLPVPAEMRFERWADGESPIPVNAVSGYSPRFMRRGNGPVFEFHVDRVPVDHWIASRKTAPEGGCVSDLRDFVSDVAHDFAAGVKAFVLGGATDRAGFAHVFAVPLALTKKNPGFEAVIGKLLDVFGFADQGGFAYGVDLCHLVSPLCCLQREFITSC